MHWSHFRPRWLSRVWNTVTVGRYYPEERHPISRSLFAVLRAGLPVRAAAPSQSVIAAAVIVVLTTVPVYLGLGHEFMPRLNEGTILYMPTTLPGISVAEASQWLAGPGPCAHVLPGSGAGARQGPAAPRPSTDRTARSRWSRPSST